MGSASSKAARTASSAVKSGKNPTWAGARSPAPYPKIPPTGRARQPWASKSKNEEIETDAKDPQLQANLSRLKPVRVYHHMLPTAGAQSDGVRELFESRARAEVDAARGRGRTPRNRLHVSSLLAEKYGVDEGRLERLVRSVNVPSVREGGHGGGGGMRYVRDAESGEDAVVTEVEWREPGRLRG
ncbi:hypothetical protein BC826DRAFT_1063009 [Russula brevipes]|nr:hypothetical protein BC826DRAFT_1063009 [Russula brevipes]